MNTSKSLLTFLLTLIAMSFVAGAQDGEPLRVNGAWVRPSVTETSAAYLQIYNETDAPVELIRVETPATAQVELHQTQMQGDIMRMNRLDALEIDATSTLTLAPNGLHIMLMGLQTPLIEGETLPLTLTFDNGFTLAIDATITQTPIPYYLAADAHTQQALDALNSGHYVGQVQNPPILVQDFSVPSNMPELTQFSDLSGRWRVVFFGYMHCPDFCPLTLVEYKRVKAALSPEETEQVAFVYISVDAVRDTAEVLTPYLANFDPEFIGFSADDATLSRIQPDYGFYYMRRMDSGTQAVYTIDHSTRSYLIDPDGILRASFAYGTHPNEIANALSWYIAQGAN